jgi:hypothetical protein
LPVLDDTVPAGIFNVLGNDEVLEPGFVPIVEHLMVDVGRQINGIARRDGIAGVSTQNLTATAEDVIGLFDARMFVVVGGFPALEGVEGTSFHSREFSTVVILIFKRGVDRSNALPAYGAHMCNFRLSIAPVFDKSHVVLL